MEESKAINEENLEQVAGGDADGAGGACFFQPEYPYQSKVEYGGTFVKCKSWCNVGQKCHCGSRVQCVDRWHLMERDKDIAHRWYPQPIEHFNHREPDKVVDPLH